MTLYFATGNANKFKEVRAKIPGVAQLKIELPEIQSDNPRDIVRAKLLAARAHHKGGAIFVEDVSLHLDALGGFPGPLVKWLLKDVSLANLVKIATHLQSAGVHARATIGYIGTNDEIHYFEGIVKGKIVSARGTGGFGFDPIFQPEGSTKTFAQMSLEEKSTISHRGLAIRELQEFLSHNSHTSVVEERVFFSNGKGMRLCAQLSLVGETTAPIAILCHGLGSDKDSSTNLRLQGLLNDAGISTLRLDFFGHGESDGAFGDITPSEGVRDLEAAIGYLTKRGYARIGIIASSFSGYAAYVVAAKHPELFALALKCPVADFAEKGVSTSAHDDLETWRKRGYTHYITKRGKERFNYTFVTDSEKASAYPLAKKITVPTLIVHGSEDKVVGIAQSHKMAEMMPHAMIGTIKGANHRFSNEEHFKKMIGMLADFLIGHSTDRKKKKR